MKDRNKGATSFYSELDTIEDIKLYCVYNKINFSELLCKIIRNFHTEHIEDIELCKEKQTMIDKIIDSYKNNF